MTDFSVELGALRTDAGTFETGGDSVANLTRSLEQWRDWIPDWGILGECQQPFEDLVARVGDYTREGDTELHSVGQNLRHIADVYEREEQENVHLAMNIY
ncbi:hypothetical protein HJ590_17690 [Naumannella sp. ID2617S]|uniref:WXG100 family type VII secretion target n=1 Tax=Enemella dayhoffiae TaxID=2016507 RepID=A0A255H9W4_9ACTN|nr:hypothetical protein [Enemella dayhoffiae]NNG21354.1 hypothetical protein [Naumannella sp. ID2617S]OYO24481.1 hypothetical protein CGZ93_03585 [Enemella dayhoffiae]